MRARNLKPGYFKNEVLGSADPICGHVFQGLWGLADREGRLEYRLHRIHVEINAYREMETTRCAIEWLVEHGFVMRYEVGGAHYLLVRNFREHQHPHVKEPPSKLPAPGGNGGDPGAAPGQHRASTGPAPDKPGASTSDSGLRTPDSPLLTPDSGLHGPAGQKPPSRTEPETSPRLDFDDLRRAASARMRMPGHGRG